MDNNTAALPESKKTHQAAVNFVSSIVLILFCLLIIFMSLRMPRPGGWGTAPGLLPLILCISVFLMSLGLLISAIRNQGAAQCMNLLESWSFSKSVKDTSNKRQFLIIILSGFYFLFLYKIAPFEISSFIYLILTLQIFWKEGKWTKIMMISIILPIAMSVSFRLIFGVLLPGGSIFDWLIVYLRG